MWPWCMHNIEVNKHSYYRMFGQHNAYITSTCTVWRRNQDRFPLWQKNKWHFAAFYHLSCIFTYYLHILRKMYISRYANPIAFYYWKTSCCLPPAVGICLPLIVGVQHFGAIRVVVCLRWRWRRRTILNLVGMILVVNRYTSCSKFSLTTRPF